MLMISDFIPDVEMRSRRWLVAINRFAGHSCETGRDWDETLWDIVRHGRDRAPR